MTIGTVIKAGFFSMLQDSGRSGFLREGVPISGSMDSYSASLANLLVGNRKNEPVIEMTMSGLAIRFLVQAIVAITGGDMEISIDGKTAEMYQTLRLLPDQVLNMGSITTGCRSYLSISGGFSGSNVLGSYSTYTRAKWGGIQGRAIKKGDQLLRIHTPNVFSLKKIPEHLQPKISAHPQVRFIPGPEWHLFAPDFQRLFRNNPLTILPDSDRMGIRMTNSDFPKNSAAQMISSPVASGTIQLTPDNQFIVLMKDGQTCGGYPRIGNVITADHPKLAQLKPGNTCSFRKVNLDEAHLLLKHQQKKLESINEDL